MYNLFCNNYKNYMKINGPSYRKDIAKVIEGLTDIKLYSGWKEAKDPRYYEASNLVYQIREKKHYSFETLAFELQMHGYEPIASEEYDKDVVEEQLKLVGLLLTTHYWIDMPA